MSHLNTDGFLSKNKKTKGRVIQEIFTSQRSVAIRSNHAVLKQLICAALYGECWCSQRTGPSLALEVNKLRQPVCDQLIG